MVRAGLALIVLFYLPGALLFRWPAFDRERRAALDAAERVFWHVMLSVAWTLAVALALAAANRYGFDRLILIDGALCALVLMAGRSRLGYQGRAARPVWHAILPIVLVALGLWRFFPTSEYVIGGKDPGTYINEGVQIAQRGGLVIHDPVVAAVPPPVRDLFFPDRHEDAYFSNRFMGFFLRDPGTGAVTGQFPHAFPVSIALGYGVAGLTGARDAVAVWAILGVVALFFAAARLVGRPAAFAAAALLALHTIQVWYARYPNAEVAMQACVFALLLAFARAHEDDDPFFAPVASVLIGLLIFLRIDAALVLGALVLALLARAAAGRPWPRLSFVLPLAVLAVPAWAYWASVMRPYYWRDLTLRLEAITTTQMSAAAVGAIAAPAVAIWLRRRHADWVRRWLPLALVAVVVAGAGYAEFLRQPGGKLTDYDALAFRTFVSFFLLPIGAIGAVAGLIVVARRDFWRDPTFITVASCCGLFLFYKIRIVPEHFWIERRLVPVVLPSALMFVAAAAIGRPAARLTGLAAMRAVAGGALLMVLGWQYAAASAPLLPHVEYAGIIPYLETLAGSFHDRDLVIVEARDANADTHVFGPPLAYIYARNVLVLDSARPDKAMLQAFIADARTKYDRVLFLGGGGTDLLSRRIQAVPIADERAKVPEYASTPWNVYPEGVRRKDFDYSIYELRLDAPPADGFSLDVGDRDDLNVIRFNAKETSEGRTIRWTGPRSVIAVPGMTGREREIALVLHDGGRPAKAPPARVTVLFNGEVIGTIAVTPGFQTYRLSIPAELAARAATRDDPAEIRLDSTTWVPRDYLGGTDDRQLGVMLDRVEIPLTTPAGSMCAKLAPFQYVLNPALHRRSHDS